MNELLIPPLPWWIKRQLHYPTWNFKTIIKSLFKNDIEERIKLLCDCKYVVLTDSASTALTLGLIYLNKPKKVYMPSYCCKSVANAIINAGLTPHFYDITKDLQPQPIQKDAIIIVPHFHGEQASIEKFKGTIVEDKAMRIQDPLTGEFGILSFNIGKQIQSTGGGALITNNKQLAEQVKKELTPQVPHDMVKQFLTYIFTVILRKLTMFIYYLLVKLKLTQREKDISKRYEETNEEEIRFRPKQINWIQKKLTQSQLTNLTNVLKPKHITLITKKDRYPILQSYSKQGIEVDWTWLPLHLQTKYSKYPKEQLTNTEKLWKKTITIRTK